MNAKMVFELLGGLGLFVYGMKLMGDGLQKAAGEKLKRILEV
ncbi:MAG: Na/Pi cotransporter family protein, partial [Clostridiales bacterium]|nr:Na/Pi cotransporter family protein [Clostridiales bacterium]